MENLLSAYNKNTMSKELKAALVSISVGQEEGLIENVKRKLELADAKKTSKANTLKDAVADMKEDFKVIFKNQKLDDKSIEKITIEFFMIVAGWLQPNLGKKTEQSTGRINPYYVNI